jgi:hypothetical protein
MTKQQQLETLKDFNEKAEKLLNSSIGKGVLSQDLRCTMSWKVGEGTTITSPDFNPELLDAFLLTFRMFIQNNDRISIGRMKALYDEMPIRQELKDGFDQARDDLNVYLDLRPIFTVAGEPKSYRDLSHMNESKRATFRQWMSNPVVEPHIWTQFLMILAKFLGVISFIRVFNYEAIKELEENP